MPIEEKQNIRQNKVVDVAKNNNLNKEYRSYVIPSMIAFAFSGVYSIVDGWFIGNFLGGTGLAAINIAYPIGAFMQAVGTGIGMGGAILIGISIGRRDEEGERSYLGVTFFMLALACVILMSIFWISYPVLLKAFGASGEILELGKEYTKYMIFGTGFQIFGTGLIPLIRNFNGATIAMIAMIIGFLGNVVLDGVFIVIFEWELMGAALATVTAQMLAVIPSLLFLIKKNKLFGFIKFKNIAKRSYEILKGSLSSIGTTFYPSVMLIIVNRAAVTYGGDDALAVYAIVMYVIYVVLMMAQGVGDGSQPLISRYYGNRNLHNMKHIRKLSVITAEIIAIAGIVIMIPLTTWLATFFGADEIVTKGFEIAFPIFTIGFIFVAILRTISAYFYATKKNMYAYIVIYGEPFLLLLLSWYIMPVVLDLGIIGIWISVPLTQAILTVIAVSFIRKVDTEIENEIERR